MKTLQFLAVSIGVTFLFTACDPPNECDCVLPLGAYDNGVFILNQGGFGSGNADVSYLSNDFATFQNEIFDVVNQTDLGDTAQDLAFDGDTAWIVLNGSNRIEIVNRYTFRSIASIETGLGNPRYAAFASGKAYVTNWGDGSNPADDYVAVIDPLTRAVTATIPVAEGPERIVEHNGKLYVLHAGGFGYGNSVTVIDVASNTVSSTIAVGDVPNSFAIDGNLLYVMCGGKPFYAPEETTGSIAKIDLVSNTVSNTLGFTGVQHPANLTLGDGALYYTVDSNVFKTSAGAVELPTTALFSTTPQGVYGVYSFAVHEGKIFVGDAVDYSAAGKVYVYAESGALEHDYTVGVIPAGFYFN